MILVLVFSMDRALQLDGCLRSLTRHLEDASVVHVVVVYRATSVRLQGQYDELARSAVSGAEFVAETSFRSQVLGILGRWDSASVREASWRSVTRLWRTDPLPPETALSSTQHVLFVVDDTLFVRSIPLEAAVDTLQSSPEALGYSLRLGRNTTYSYVLDRPQRPPEFLSIGKGILRYDWTSADGDFGYPLEISSSLYRIADIRALTTRGSFADPNTLESLVATQTRRFSRSKPFLLCSEDSVAFSAPLNRVQAVYENRAGGKGEWSVTSLAERYDKGQRINIRALDGFVPASCHQEVELSFEPRST